MADAWTRRHGKVGSAVTVEAPQGIPRSWFVPVVYKDRLLGFFELSLDLVPQRYSSFQRREGALDGCPPAVDWLDPETIRRRAQARLDSGETAGKPYLSFDALPARLAWAVPVTSTDRGERILFVAGDAVFEGRAPGEFTGGPG